MAKKYPSDQQDQYMLRFPDGMRDKLKDEAAKNGRSMNAEIIMRLELSLNGMSFGGETSLDQITSYYLRRLQSGAYVEGQDKSLSDLIKRSKEMELAAIKLMVDGALELLEISRQAEDR